MKHLYRAFLACLTVLFVSGYQMPAFADDTDALDRDLAEQWSTRDIPAQTGNQVFTSAGRFELGLNLGYLATDDYYNYVPVELNVHYRFTEYWGLMLRSSLLMIHGTTTLSDFLDTHQTTIDPKMLGDEQIVDFSLTGTFHPVYGKWTAETMNLGRFDWGIYAGIGLVVSKSANKSRTKRETMAHAEGVFGTDFHFFVLNWLAIRLDASLRFSHAPTQWVVPCTITAGVSFFMPSLTD